METKATKLPKFQFILCLVLAFFTASITISGLWLLFRFEDVEIRRQVLGMVCLSAGFFGSISFFGFYYQGLWLFPVSLISIMLLPGLLSPLANWALLLLVLLGLFGFLGIIFTTMKGRISILVFALSVLTGLLIGTYYFLFAQAGGYSSLVNDLWIFTDSLHHDTLFHSAISSMLYGFNAPSTGLDGIPPLFYHVGIHRWVASCIHILGGTTVTLLANSRDILWIPIFLLTLTLVPHLPARNLNFSWFGATVLAIACERIVSYISGGSHLLSESYLLSLPIFLSLVPVGLNWLNLAVDPPNYPRKVHVISLIIVLSAIILCAVAKMSTGLILVIFLTACWLTPQLLDRPKHWLRVIVPMIIFSTVVLYAVQRVLLPMYRFRLFAFYLDFPKITALQFIFFIVSLTIAWLLLRGEPRRRNALCLTLTVVFLAGQLPGLLLEIGGGSAGYFSDPVMWLSLVCIVAIMGKMGMDIEVSIATTATSNLEWVYRSKLQNFLVLAFFLYSIPFLCRSFVDNQKNFYVDILAETNIQMKKVLSIESSPLALDVEESEKGSPLDKIYRFRQRLVKGKQALLKYTRLGYIKSLTNRLIHTKDVLVYVPPPEGKFNLWQEDESLAKRRGSVCWSRPLAIPAITGLPMLNGVRAGVGDCPDTEYYGMHVYGGAAKNRQLDSRQMCDRARSLGFKRVLEIGQDNYKIHVCM